MNSHICLILFVQLVSIASIEATCKLIKGNDPYAASGVYTIYTPWTEKKLQVYCEMGLDNGGYTFINPKDLQYLSNEDIQAMFTDKSSFLMRIRKCDNHQPYIILKQLTRYRNIPLKLGLNENYGYVTPVNTKFLGNPYLYFGFLPRVNAANRNVQGVWANGKDYTFQNCDSNPSSYFALFANYYKLKPTNAQLNINYPFINQVFNSANPSKSEMPVEYFYFMEAHFGGCGAFTQTDSRLNKKCILSVAIGFR